MAPEDLHVASSLWLFAELVDVLAGAAGRLAKVTLRTRGNLVQDRHGLLHADALLRRWAGYYRSLLEHRHIEFELVLDRSVHARRVLLQGRARGVEIRLEWGLAYFDPRPDNLARPPAERHDRATEVLVAAFPGHYSDLTQRRHEEQQLGPLPRGPLLPVLQPLVPQPSGPLPAQPLPETTGPGRGPGNGPHTCRRRPFGRAEPLSPCWRTSPSTARRSS